MTRLGTSRGVSTSAGLHGGAALVMDRRARFDRIATRVWINGPGSYRFELTPPGEPTIVLRSNGEIAMALYLCGQPLTWDLPPARIAELVVAGVAQRGYATVAEHAPRWRACNHARHQLCVDLARRLSRITEDPNCYAAYPQWQPQWRQVTR